MKKLSPLKTLFFTLFLVLLWCPVALAQLLGFSPQGVPVNSVCADPSRTYTYEAELDLPDLISVKSTSWQIDGGSYTDNNTQDLYVDISWLPNQSDYNITLTLEYFGATEGGFDSGEELQTIFLTLSGEAWVVQPPNVYIEVEDLNICSGQPVEGLRLEAHGASSYVWEGPGVTGFKNDEITLDFTLQAGQTRTYRVTGTTAQGCSNTAQVVLRPSLTPQAPSFDPVYVYSGTNVVLAPTAPANTLFNWYNTASGGVPLTVPQASFNLGPVSVLQENQERLINYYAESTHMGCVNPEGRVEARVTVIPTVSIVSENGESQLSPGNNIRLEASHGYSYENYTWRKDGVPIGDNASSLVVTEPGTYTLTVGKYNREYTAPGFTVGNEIGFFPQSNVCTGATVTYNAYTALDQQANVFIESIDWEITGGHKVGGNANQYQEVDIVWNPNQSVYKIKLTVEYSDEPVSTGNTQTYVLERTVNVGQVPQVYIDVEELPICVGQPVQGLRLEAHGASEYSWTGINVDGFTNDEITLNFTLQAGQSRTYTVTGTNSQGCSSSATVVLSPTGTPAPTPVFNPLVIYSGQKAIITPLSPSNTLLIWYDSPNGGNSLGGFESYDLGILSVDQPNQEKSLSYYAEAVSGSCPSLGGRVHAPVFVVPTVEVQSANGLTYLEPGGTLRLETTHDFNYDDYEWRKDGQLYSQGADNWWINVSQTGAYTLTVTRRGVSYQAQVFLVGELNADKNYTRIDYALKPEWDEPTFIGADNLTRQTAFQYYDGLGRPVQSVAKAFSPNGGKDMVVHSEYDHLGRQAKQFLPFVSDNSNGSFNYGAENKIMDFYDPGLSSAVDIAKDEVPYTLTSFEHAPLSRPTELAGLGQNWAGTSAKFKQYINEQSDAVLVWQFNPSDNSISTDGSYYPKNSLWVQEVVDEQNQKMLQYLNRRGQVVLKRGFLDSPQDPYLHTYYIYDEMGRIRYVVPPLAVKKLTEDPALEVSFEIKKLLYYYEYDGRGRLIVKQVPDTRGESNESKGETWLVYDDLDRLVLSQDAVQRDRNEWNFIKYDPLSRPVMSGLYYPGAGVNANSQAAMQDEVPEGSPTYSNQNGDVNEDPLDHRVLPDALGFVSDGPTQAYKAHISLDVGNDQDYMALENGTNYTFEIDPSHTTSPTAATSTPAVLASSFSNQENIVCEVLSISFYDNYDFIEEEHLDYDAGQYTALNTPAPSARTEVKGLSTGSMVKVMDEQGLGEGPEWLSTVSYYDERYRSVQIKGENHKGGIDIFSLEYENIVSGEILQSHTWHQNPEDVVYPHISIVETFSYDRLGRLDETSHSINQAPAEVLAKYHYNELGQVIRKELAPNATDETKQILDYSYNIRGWLKKMNEESLVDTRTAHKDLFSMELFYEEGFRENGEVGKKQYNGNISGMRWTSLSDQTGGGSAVRSHSYAYSYDKLNRLTSAIYAKREGDLISNPVWSNSNENFSVDLIEYDVNGNITRLKRQGMTGRGAPDMNGERPASFGLMDDLVYRYDGNRLIGVDDMAEIDQGIKTGVAGDFSDWRGDIHTAWMDDGHPAAYQPSEYSYDKNGSLIADENKGITGIQYNHLSLATQINYGSSNSIQYHYDAAGIKLQKEVYEDNQLSLVTDYIGIFIYENDELAFIQMAEGRVLPPMRTGRADFDYEYHIQDHLGNLRVAYRKGEEDISYQASMEPEKAIEERREFLNTDKTRDETWRASGAFSAKLNSEQPLGPWKEIQIGKGDVIDISVQAHYEPRDDSSPDNPLHVFLEVNPNYSDFTNEFGENQPQGNSVNRLRAGILLNPSTGNPQDNEAPNAYLKYLVYDLDHNLISEGAYYVGNEAKGDGDPATQDPGQALTLNYTAQEDCYIDIFVANESGDAEVWFDDLTIDLEPHLIVQENAYYPFGLEIATLSKSNRLPNHFTFNGQSEKQKDLGGGDGYFYETDWRGYDPQLGRFKAVDALASKYAEISPYQYAFNNPISYNDPLGLEPCGSCGGPPPPSPPPVRGFGFTGTENVGKIDPSSLGLPSTGGGSGAAADDGSVGSNDDTIYDPFSEENLDENEDFDPLDVETLRRWAFLALIEKGLDDWQRNIVVGRAFEDAWGKWSDNDRNGRNFNTNVRGKDVRPDFLDFAASIWFWTLITYPDGFMTEVKTTKNTIDLDAFNKQIYGILEALSRETTTEGEIGSLRVKQFLLVVPHGTIISDDIKNKANEYNVYVNVSKAYYNKKTKGVVFSTPKGLNNKKNWISRMSFVNSPNGVKLQWRVPTKWDRSDENAFE